MIQRGLASFLALVLSLGGCASLIHYSDKDVEAAYQRKDYGFINDMCSGKRKEQDFSGAKHLACSYQYLEAKRPEIAAWEQAGDVAKLADFCKNGEQVKFSTLSTAKHEACLAKVRALDARFAEGAKSCDTVRAAWAERIGHGIVESDAAVDAAMAAHVTAAAKYVECKHWDGFFEEIAGWSPMYRNEAKYQKRGLEAMLKVADLEAELVAYVGRKAGAAFVGEKLYSERVIEWVVGLLIEQKRLGLCAKLAPAASGGDPAVIYGWLPYFEAAACKEGIPLAVANLTAERSEHRHRACNVLGKIGTKAELAKVKAIAEGDAYNVVEDRVQIYPVRDACAGAASKISVKGK